MKKLILLLLFFFTSLAFAQDPSADLTQLLKNMRSMKADFTETLVSKNGKVLQKLTGQMAFQRPGQFRWEVQKPTKQLIVTNGKRLWIYEPELEQVTIRSLSKAAGETPALLLSDADLSLTKEFKITASSDDSSLQWFALTPKDNSSMIALLKLGFANSEIQQMQIRDHLGHVTQITFTHIQPNISLQDSLFKFRPPARVDVIDETKKR